jgi:hypothetical protein
MKFLKKYKNQEINSAYGDKRNRMLQHNDNLDFDIIAFIVFVIALILTVSLFFYT